MQPGPGPKDPNAQVLGSKGGLSRAANQTPEQRSELARRAAFAKHHPMQFQQRKERAEQIARMVQEALNGKQMPLL
ncbi:MAG TPA: hypothetical protein VH599_07335 [Ktedonobacterales bacterium]|jgi:hypothetical protein